MDLPGAYETQTPISQQSRTQQAETWGPSDRQTTVGSWVLGNQFTAVAGSVVMLEIVLGAWPVVATVLWKGHAVDTWIHFFWWLKAFFLMLAVCQQYWATRRKRNKYGSTRRRGQTKFAGLNVTSPLTTFDLCVGATASCELSTWIMISVVGHALLSGILLLLVLVLRNEFLSNTEWVLSLVFNVVGIVESIGSPVLVTSLSIQGAAMTGLPRRRRRRPAAGATNITSRMPTREPRIVLPAAGGGRPMPRTSLSPPSPPVYPGGTMAAAYGF